MGLEATCSARWKGVRSKGRAHLDKDELTLSGKYRLGTPLFGRRGFEVPCGTLFVPCEGHVFEVDLGKAAQRWFLKIRYPRSLT